MSFRGSGANPASLRAAPKRPPPRKMSEPQSNPPAGDAGTQPTPQAKPAPAVPAPAVPVPAVPVPAGILARIEERVKHRLGPKPIRKKLTVISMLACTAALVIAGLGFLVGTGSHNRPQTRP